MTYRFIVIFLCIIISVACNAQRMKYEGTYPPDSAVLILLHEYATIFEDYKNVSERDAKRKIIVSPAYFYHGMDVENTV